MPSQLLTDAAVRAFRVEEGQRLAIYDGKAKGLCLRVSVSSKSWSFLYRPKGSTRQRRFTIGDYPSWSLAQAREKTFALRRLVDEGGDPVAAAHERRDALTVSTLVDRYIDRMKGKLRSWRDYEGLLKRDFVPAFGRRRADEITRSEIANLLDKIAARAPVVSNRMLNIISALYSWAVSEGLAPLNPVTGLKRRHLEVPKERVLSDAEIGSFWRKTDELAPVFRDVFRLILLTGQRPGECAGMRAEEVDLAAAVWTLPAARVKNKHKHTVPLVGEALAIVRRTMEGQGSGLLFVSPRGKALTPQNLAKAFERLRDLKTFESPATPHDLRRTAATLLGRLEVDRMTVAQILNHASITRGSVTGSTYDRHDYLAQKRRALMTLDAEIARIRIEA